MVKAKLYNLSKKETTTVSLSDQIFSQTYNKDLLYQAVTIYLANQRSAGAHTKQRSAVRGGGRKPWRQKGTGKARAGSSRSPIWRGGGITFGPSKQKNYSRRLPQKMRQKAIFIALSLHVKNNSLYIINKIDDLKQISTKAAINMMEKMPIENKSVLFIIDKNLINLRLSLNNLPYIKTTALEILNVYDVLNYDVVVLPKDILLKIEKLYLSRNKKVNDKTSKDKKTSAKNKIKAQATK